jgi:phage N-6-adenine-methyltransferase
LSFGGALHWSKFQDWATPQVFVDWLEDELKLSFIIDACATKYTRKCPDYFTLKDDGLNQEWLTVGDVFLNPPYAKGVQELWINKAVKECMLGNCKSVVALIPARTETKLFHELIVPNAAAIYFLKGRINFQATYAPNPQANSTFPTMVVIFNKMSCDADYEPYYQTLEPPVEVRRDRGGN